MSVTPSAIASVVDKYLRGGQAQAFPRSALESDWRQWLPAMMPDTFTCGFADHHARFWDWLWSIKRGVRPRPYVLPLPRHGGKSSSVEGAVVALGARKIRDYGFYCHERGTSIYDPARPDAGWGAVEDHPTARSIVTEGFTVELSGLPNIVLAETVTAEHRYWAMRIATRYGHDAQEYLYGRPHWIEAQHLDWNTWIGYPIDQTVLGDTEYPPLPVWNGSTHDVQYDLLPYSLFHNPEFWWMVGYWWGDGSLGGCRRSQISFCCAEKYPDRQDRLVEFLASTGNHPKIRRVAATAQFEVRIGDSVLARWLHTWKRGNSRKEPPPWVEYLPLDCQRELICGYIAADANIDDRGVHLSSIHLPGLLSVRRMLMRLGVVCHVASRRTPETRVFPGERTYHVQRAYMLQIEHPGLLGLPETLRSSRKTLNRSFIRDGFLWSRVLNVSESDQREFIPIQTESETYLTAFGRSHNCSMTQPQADDHLTSIEPKLGAESVKMYYPDLSERHVGLHGDGTHWRRQRLWTKRGMVIDALGIDTAARGRKLGDQRPSLIIFDDIDDKDESSTARLKKMETMKSDIIGAASHDAMIIFIQNKVHRDSIMSQLIDGRADFLADAIIEQPLSALGDDFKYETRSIADDSGYTRQRHFIQSGTPIWEGQDIEACQGQLDNMGLDSFLREVQQDVERATTGALLSMFEEKWSVITKTEFQMVYGRAATDKNGDMRIPAVGYLANFQDVGCLTLETELLTKDGWKRHDQLKVGELVAGYNWKRPLYPRRWKHRKTAQSAIKSWQYKERSRTKRAIIDGPTEHVGELVWTPLRGIVYKSDQPLVKVESKSFDFTCTPDHAWIVRRKKRERMKRDTYQRQPLNKIPRSTVGGGTSRSAHLVLAAKCADQGEIECPPAMAAVLGWVITDGWISKGLAYISQKNYPEAVIADLNESGLKWHEIQPHKDGVRIFSIGGKKGLKRLSEETGFTTKDKLPELVTRLSPEARERMLEAMFMADGTGRRGPRGVGRAVNFCQNRGPVLEAFEILATLSGVRLSRPRLHEGGGLFPSCIRAIEKYGHRQYRVGLMAVPHVLIPRINDLPGLYDVWCPTVDEGAVVARCNGQIAITGNSTPGHPNANIWAWRPEQGMQLSDSVFGYRELTLPEYPEPVTMDPSPLTVAMAIHRLEAPWQEGENHRMTRRLSHEKPDWANFYNMDLPKVNDPDTGRPMKALRYGQWSPVKSGGLGTLQSYMAVIEREHSDVCPHKQGDPPGCSQWLHAENCPHRSDQRQKECWARRNLFRPWLWGRSRFMLVVDDDQGAIEGGKQRQPYNARGFVRLRAEIPRFNEEKLKGGPAKVFDDMLDTALKLAENFFVPIARQKEADQIQAAIPEAYRQNATPELILGLNDLARQNYPAIQYVLETEARAKVQEQRKSSQIYSHGAVRRGRG